LTHPGTEEEEYKKKYHLILLAKITPHCFLKAGEDSLPFNNNNSELE
jgi:hypothetical protein